MARDLNLALQIDDNGVPIQHGALDRQWQPIRSSLILSNSQVVADPSGTGFDVSGCSQIALHINFGKGSLTNCILSWSFGDETTLAILGTRDMTSGAVTGDILVTTYTLLVDTNCIVAIPNPGCTFFKTNVIGTGTVTGSLMALEAMRGCGGGGVFSI